MTIGRALAEGAALLGRAGVVEAQRDARRLMARALGVAPGRVTLMLNEPLDPAVAESFHADLALRAERRPLSHILGGRDFYGRWFEVGADVLDPRSDTETLVATALETPFTEVLDLGTGSGCILVTLLAERSGARGTGTDISAAALDVARRNAAALGVAERCRFLRSDWFSAVEGRFDLVVANPPYIAAGEMAGLAPELSYEPRGALTDEADGLDAYRAITAGTASHLRPGGRLLLEIGWTQGAQVARMVAAAGFDAVTVLPDLEGRDRVVRAIRPADCGENPRKLSVSGE